MRLKGVVLYYHKIHDHECSDLVLYVNVVCLTKSELDVRSQIEVHGACVCMHMDALGAQ